MIEEQSNPRAVKIGELLIGVGVLTTGDLTEAIQIAKRMGVPIGRVLVMSGCVTEQRLQQALELQSLVKDGLCDPDVGMKALKKVFKDNVDLPTALKSLNWEPAQDANSNKLGELLMDSNIVSRGQLERALETSFQSGMPLGGTLVLQGVLSAQLLPTILHTQEQIRDNKMSRDQAIDTLQQALMFWAKADQSKTGSLEELGRPAMPSAPQAKTASSIDIARQTQQGQPALATGAQPSPTASTSGQSVVPPAPSATPAPPAIAAEAPAAPAEKKPVNAKPYLQTRGEPADNAPTYGVRGASAQHTYHQAVDTSDYVHTREYKPFQEEHSEPNTVSLLELMKLSGYCTQATVDEALQDALRDSRLAAKMLLSIGFLDATTLNTYVYCQALIGKGTLRTDQALYVLSTIRQKKIGLEQALQELGVPMTELP